MDEGSPYYGKTPVTPVMDFQIDNITIHQLLIPLRKKLLQELQKKVLNNKPEDFLEIYLTIFILLHNMELTIAHDRWFAMRYSMQVCNHSIYDKDICLMELTQLICRTVSQIIISSTQFSKARTFSWRTSITSARGTLPSRLIGNRAIQSYWPSQMRRRYAI